MINKWNLTSEADGIENKYTNIKKFENIDLELAVSVIRDGVYYEKANCLYENMAMAAFLRDMDITCKFIFGEFIYISKSSCSYVVHRNFNNRDKRFKKIHFHCWLDIDGKILDISPGSWTRNEHQRRRIEYIFGNYNNGFDIQNDFDRLYVSKNFNYKNNNEIILPKNTYSYCPFESIEIAKIAYARADKYRTNMTMNEDLKLRKTDRNLFVSLTSQYNSMLKFRR